MLVDEEAVEQAVVDGVGVGDLEAGAHHPGVDDVDLRRLELDRFAIQLCAVVDDLLVARVLGGIDHVREHAVLVLELATRLLLGLDAHVQPLDEVSVGDLRLPEVAEAAHVDGADLMAGAQDPGSFAQRAGHAHLAGEAVARPPGRMPIGV